MRVLAIDTSQATGSVAIKSAAGITSISFGCESSHLVELSRAVAALLDQVDLAVADIDRIALVSGPGSFTGLRIGFSYVKGLYAARPVAVVLETSLRLLAAANTPGSGRVCPMVDARKDEVYAAVYAREGEVPTTDGLVPSLSAITAPCAVKPEEFLGLLSGAGVGGVGAREAGRRDATMGGVGPVIFVGSGAQRYRDKIGVFFDETCIPAEAACHVPSTELLCRMAPALAPLGASEILRVEPFYIRSSQAKLRSLKRIRTHE